MVDDDDDPKTAPASDAPAGDKAAETPTEPPEGEQPEGEETEKKAPAEEEPDLGDEADDEQDDDEGEDEDEGDVPKRKASRAQRYKQERDRLKAENETLRSRTNGSLPSDQQQLQRALDYAVWQEIGDPPDENDPRFQGNYVALERERQAWENDRRQVTRDVRKKFAEAIRHEQERVTDLVAEHKERVSRFRTKVKDYDEVMARATLPVLPHVERLLLASKKSERLGYALGKNQNKLAQLNRMDPESAAREIGRLEGRLSLPPQSKTQTKARKPITPLKGAGASPPSGLAAVNAYIKKQYGNRA